MSYQTGPTCEAGERLEDYQSLVASLVDHYQPADQHERALVEDLAFGRWMLRRNTFADRQRAAAERSFNRALKNVEAFRKERVNEYRWAASYDVAVKRLELAKRKYAVSVARGAGSGAQSSAAASGNPLA